MDQTARRRDVLLATAAAGLGLVTAATQAGSNLASDTASGRLPFHAGDVRLPGLVFAVIARPPLSGWRPRSIDADAVVKLRHLHSVVPLAPTGPTRLTRLGGVALLARDGWTARRALDLIEIEWRPAVPSAMPVEDGNRLPARECVSEPQDAHRATADVRSEACTAWAALSAPHSVRTEMSRLLAMPASGVSVLQTLRNGPDCDPAYVYDAARLSKLAGVPVSLSWTRLDEAALGFRGMQPSA